MANLGSLVYYIKAKNSQFKRGMKENKKEVKEFDKQVDKSQGTLQKYSSTFKKAGIALTAFGAIVTGVSFKLAKMASDANEIQSRFDHVFGELSKDANEWAENFAESFGQSRSEIKSMMATLQDTLVPMGVAEQKAFKLNKKITQLAIDMSSFANVPLEQAMNDIQSAIVGQSRPMRKYGSVLTETRVKQYALAEGIVKTDRELTEQEKIVSRVQLMFEDMEKAQGDYQRTQDSFANQLRETKNTLKNIGEEIGENVLPVFEDLLSNVKDLLEWFDQLPDATKKVISKWTVWSGLIAGITGPLALIVGYLPQIANGISMIVSNLGPLAIGSAIVLGVAALVDHFRDMDQLTKNIKENISDIDTLEGAIRKRKEIRESIELMEKRANTSGRMGVGGVLLEEREEYQELLRKEAELTAKIEKLKSKSKKPEKSPGGGGGGGSEGESGLPGWMPEEWPESETPEVDEEKAKQIVQRIMDMGYETRIAQMEGLQQELMRLDLSEKQELRGVKNKTLIASIERKYEAQREATMERYAEMWKQQRDEEMRNRFEMNDITLERYKLYLETRLDEYEKYSNKWVSIKQELMSLDEEPEDTFGIEDIRENYNAALEELKRKNEVYGESFDFAEAKADLLKRTIDEIIALGDEGMNSEFLDKLVATYKELTSEDEETVESFNWLTDSLVDVGYEIETANQAFQKWKNSLIDGLSNAIAKGENLADVFANIADQIAAMVIKQAIVKPMTDAVLGWAGLSTGHLGGLVTTAGIIPEMHDGGLANDEIVAKLQTGERVLSREENKAYEAGGETNVTLIQAVDSKSFQQMLAENRATVTQLSVEDIMKNGQLRKALKQYL